MVKAYVFVIAKPGSRLDVSAAEFLKWPEVKEAAQVYGEYDMVVKLEVPKIEDLQKFIIKFRELGGVEKTTTMIAMK
jgi:DNA-binding Lrp family transcriptional regulator